jgi:hypothetical protein
VAAKRGISGLALIGLLAAPSAAWAVVEPEVDRFRQLQSVEEIKDLQPGSTLVFTGPDTPVGILEIVEDPDAIRAGQGVIVITRDELRADQSTATASGWRLDAAGMSTAQAQYATCYRQLTLYTYPTTFQSVGSVTCQIVMSGIASQNTIYHHYPIGANYEIDSSTSYSVNVASASRSGISAAVFGSYCVQYTPPPGWLAIGGCIVRQFPGT